MAKKDNRVSVNAFEKYINENYHDDTIPVEMNGLSFFVKPCLSIAEMMLFAKVVAENCFSDDGTYNPELKEFLIGKNILELYAGFAMPKNVEKQYDLVTRAGSIISEIVGRVDEKQFIALISAINDKIDAIQAVNESAIKRQVNEMYGLIDNMQQQLADMFSGVDSDGISKLVEALGNSGFDQDKFVKAYFEYKNGESSIAGGDV